MKKVIQSRQGVKDVDAAKTLVAFLDMREANNASSERQRTKTSFAPSQIGYSHGRCPRYWYYAFEGALFEDEFRATDVRNMKNGIRVHEYFQSVLDDLTDITISIEDKAVYEDPPVFGFIDAVIDWEDKEWIVEFKTARTESFKHRKETQKPPDYHIIQILIYMYVKNIRQGMLIYEDKNTQERFGIVIEWDNRRGEYVEAVFDWMKEVHSTTTGDERKLPMRNFKQTGKVCEGCPVRKTCWSDDREGDIKLKSLPTLK